MSNGVITELEFLRKLQRLLAEGDFTATYKFALLNALADLSVERDHADDGSLRLPLEAIAVKFIEYYWRQARPFREIAGRPVVLQQSTGQQASVIRTLAGQGHATLSAARAATTWAGLVKGVASTIRTMPLWKLQKLGNDVEEFLYRETEFADGSIRLLPGVPHAFRTLHGIVLDAVRGAWIRQIGRIAANRPLLRDSDLASFLFGSERGRLDGFARVLRDHQGELCLYCADEVPGIGDVDHFIAWSRYPADLGHNLVLACPKCNSSKRDFLAHPTHIENWYRTHIERATELAQRLDSVNLPHDAERTRAIAWWAYEHGEGTGAHVWIKRNSFVRLDREWRDVMRGVRLAQVAEEQAPPYVIE